MCMTNEPTVDMLELRSQNEVMDRHHRNIPVAKQKPVPPQKNYTFRVVVSFWTRVVDCALMLAIGCFFLWFALGTVGGPLFERFLGDLKWNIPILEPWMIIYLLWTYLPISIGLICCQIPKGQSTEEQSTQTQAGALDTIQAYTFTKDDPRHIEEQSQKNQRLAGERARALQ